MAQLARRKGLAIPFGNFEGILENKRLCQLYKKGNGRKKRRKLVLTINYNTKK